MIIRFRDGRTTEEPLALGQLRAAAREVFGIGLPDTKMVFESYGEAI